jgi:hypothetical protein
MLKITNDNDRRMYFFIVSYVIIIIISIALLTGDLYQKNYKDFVFASIFLLLLTALFFILLKTKHRQVIFNIIIALISIELLLQIYIGTGEAYSPYWCLVLPLFYASFLGLKKGIIGLSIYTLLLQFLLFNLVPGQYYIYESYNSIRFLLLYILVGGLSFALEYTRAKAFEYLEEKNKELEEANHEIQTLRKILPICSYCKKIRDDDGYWNQVEQYFSQHEDLIFSHGICPTCAKEHHPELDEKK